jgi:hypothetical protein
MQELNDDKITPINQILERRFFLAEKQVSWFPVVTGGKDLTLATGSMERARCAPFSVLDKVVPKRLQKEKGGRALLHGMVSRALQQY